MNVAVIEGIERLAAGRNSTRLTRGRADVGIEKRADPALPVRSPPLMIPERGPTHRVAKRLAVGFEKLFLKLFVRPLPVGHVADVELKIDRVFLFRRAVPHRFMDAQLMSSSGSRISDDPDTGRLRNARLRVG